MKRTIEIEDTLSERLDDVKYEIKEHLINYVKENPGEDFDSWQDAIRYDGTDHEIVDSSTPIYYSEIDSNYYLHGDELDEAYRAAGCYDSPPENYRQVCIYFWLEQEAWEWVNTELEEWYNDTIQPLNDYHDKRTDIDSDTWAKMVDKATSEPKAA